MWKLFWNQIMLTFTRASDQWLCWFLDRNITRYLYFTHTWNFFKWECVWHKNARRQIGMSRKCVTCRNKKESATFAFARSTLSPVYMVHEIALWIAMSITWKKERIILWASFDKCVHILKSFDQIVLMMSPHCPLEWDKMFACLLKQFTRYKTETLVVGLL